MAITPCYIQVCLIGRDDAALADILDAPLVKAFLLQVSAELLSSLGYEHPMGENWRGYQDIDPATLTRERIVEFLDRVDPESILAVVPHGTPKQVAQEIRDYVDAGLRVPKILDYGGMAGLSYSAASADNVRDVEDELMRLCGDDPMSELAERGGHVAPGAGRHRTDGLRRPTLPERFATAVDLLNSIGMDADGQAAGRGRMSLAAHLTLGVLRGPESIPDRR